MSFALVRKYIKICIGLSLTGALVWIYSAYDFSRYLNIDEMREILDSFGPYSPLFFIGLCITGVFL